MRPTCAGTSRNIPNKPRQPGGGRLQAQHPRYSTRWAQVRRGMSNVWADGTRTQCTAAKGCSTRAAAADKRIRKLPFAPLLVASRSNVAGSESRCGWPGSETCTYRTRSSWLQAEVDQVGCRWCSCQPPRETASWLWLVKLPFRCAPLWPGVLAGRGMTGVSGAATHTPAGATTPQQRFV